MNKQISPNQLKLDLFNSPSVDEPTEQPEAETTDNTLRKPIDRDFFIKENDYFQYNHIWLYEEYMNFKKETNDPHLSFDNFKANKLKNNPNVH